jgi:hypothetical protein
MLDNVAADTWDMAGEVWGDVAGDAACDTLYHNT